MPPPLSLFTIIIIIILSLSSSAASASGETFVFGVCSQAKFSSGSAYDSAVNSLMTSLVNAAMFSTYNNFTVPLATATPLAGLFQCRGDLSASDCSSCVTTSVSQLGTLCPDACGGALQLDGCFVKYDNSTFLGVKDKTEVSKKCGPSIALTSSSSDALTKIDDVLAYLETSDGMYKPFRESASGNVKGVAQCVGDLNGGDCQDCVSDAIGRLRNECGNTKWGQVYLAKCYVRFSEGGDYARGGNDNNNKNNDEFQKTLALIVALIAGVALLIIFISFWTKKCRKHECK